MSLTRRSFDIIDRKSSSKGKKLALKATSALDGLNLYSSTIQVNKYLKLRTNYLKYIYGEETMLGCGTSEIKDE